ncbi:MAG: hypothetical protein AB9872_14180 [Solidesulfovibrio sp.]
MFPLFWSKNEKDLTEKLLGKQRKFRLSRNGSAVSVTGKLLGVLRHEEEPDGLMPPAAGRMELLAVLLTKAGRFFIYYIVAYPETEDISGRQEYAHVCAGFDAMRAFLDAMHYPNKQLFADAILEQTGKTLERLGGGKRGRKPPEKPAAAVDAGMAENS